MGWCRGLGMCFCAFSLFVVMLGSYLAMHIPELEEVLAELNQPHEEPFDWHDYIFGDRDEPEPKSPLELACRLGDVNAARAAISSSSATDLNAALCESCKRNNTAVVQLLLEHPQMDVNAAPEGNTPLFFAAIYNEPEIIRLLLDHGADPSIKSNGDHRGSEYSPANLTALHGLGRGINGNHHPDRDERLNRAAALLIDAGADVHAVDSWGDTPLHACLHSRAPFFKLLLGGGADPNAQNDQGGTPMHFFFDLGERPEDLEVLMAHGARLDIVRTSDGLTPLHFHLPSLNNISALRPYVSDWGVVDAEGSTLLHRAVAKHRVGNKVISELLELGIDPNQRDNEGCQAIHMISWFDVLQEILDMLLPAGADLEARDYQGRTLLARLMYHGPSYDYYQTLPALISLGADLNTKDNDGNGVLSYTFKRHTWHFDHFNYLLSIGADPHITNNNGDTLLHLLAANLATITDDTMLNAMIKLIQLGVSPTQTNYQGMTALHIICSEPSEKLFTPSIFGASVSIDLLLDAGLIDSLNQPDHDGILPIHLAAAKSEVLVGKLIVRGADTTATTNDGRNLLHIAAAAGQGNVVGLLLEHHAYIDKLALVNARRKKRGYTPLHEASRSGQLETVSLLLEAGADVSVADNGGERPIIHELSRYEGSELITHLTDRMAEDGWINRWQDGHSYLLFATQSQLPNLETIKAIVEDLGVDINERYTEDTQTRPPRWFTSMAHAAREYELGDTALHYLAKGGHWWRKEAIKYLLQHGADPNARNDNGKTPLALAVQEQLYGGYLQKDITRILLEGGADPNIPASCGHTPLALAGRDTELVKLLLEHSAQPSQEDPEELFSALETYNLEVVKLLLDTGLDLNTIILTETQPHWHLHRLPKPEATSDSPTVRPLEYISMRAFNEAHARDQAIELIKHLLANGANPYLSSSANRSTILHYIFADGGIIQPYLELEDLDLERRDPAGRTLLITAAMSDVGTNGYALDVPLFLSPGGRLPPVPYAAGDTTRAMALYERGANLTATDNMGNNVIHLLVEHDCKHENGLVDAHCETEYRRTLELFLDKAPQLATQKNKDWLWRTPLAKAKALKTEWAVEALTEFLESA
ncbi:uncharacterized protein APUU_60898A [Aspergillus puulaauensis]|uniref:Peptidase A2 domain-containing protein n=1 Tax=Aspergillus puulaauensis TaxID=1220207 RepID=A0A7R8ASK9_9EURO|nr:uncharacterized protein APUU_60898A [Aspergillus puulaauensis]BCS27850.1 hypothetical protein APUU_60898A [Aspergillus puulaauensis]